MVGRAVTINIELHTEIWWAEQSP